MLIGYRGKHFQHRKAITLAIREEHNGDILEMAIDSEEEDTEDAEASRENRHLKALMLHGRNKNGKKYNALKVYYDNIVALTYLYMFALITGVPYWFKGVA